MYVYVCACVSIQMISVDRYLLTIEYKAVSSSIAIHFLQPAAASPSFGSTSLPENYHGINESESEWSSSCTKQCSSCDNDSSC